MGTTRRGISIHRSIHGYNGPVKISVQDTTPFDSRIFNTAKLLAEFPFNQDMNSGDSLGIGVFCLTQVRSTNVAQTVYQAVPSSQSAVARGACGPVSYLTPALSRSNFDILVNTQVHACLQNSPSAARFVRSEERDIDTLPVFDPMVTNYPV